MEQRQDDSPVLSEFANAQVAAFASALATRGSTGARPRLRAVRRLPVRTHDATPGGDAFIEHALHHLLLVAPLGQHCPESGPVAPRPRRLVRKPEAGDP